MWLRPSACRNPAYPCRAQGAFRSFLSFVFRLQDIAQVAAAVGFVIFVVFVASDIIPGRIEALTTLQRAYSNLNLATSGLIVDGDLGRLRHCPDLGSVV